jgi:HK97 family phage prohead protease
MIELERRFTPGAVEVRASDKRTIGGYAAKFHKPSRNLGGFIEQIDPAAFRKSRGDGWPEVMARYNHDDNMMLGTTSARTLRLELDDTGLVYEVDVPQSRADVFELVQRGDVSKSSFAFRTMPEGDEWGLSEENFPLRTLHAVQLVDVAPVNVPAYVDTSTGLRSLAEHMHADPDEVRSMAQAGELVRLFKRSDGGASSATFGPAARVALLARATPPWEQG